MNKKALIIIGLVLLLAVYFSKFSKYEQSAEPMNNENITNQPINPTESGAPVVNDTAELIIIDAPQPDEVITSPYTVTGRARGSWFFEATFPVSLRYGNESTEIVETFATADGDWMTEEFVPFSATIEFPTATIDIGEITFMKSNPSGLPENDMSVTVPVKFTEEL